MLDKISYKEAFFRCIDNVKPTDLYKNIYVENALAEFLAEDIVAKRDAPVFSNSAMDGFGFKKSDNTKLKVIKTIYAGDKYEDFEIKDDECVRIMTGAKVPNGIDTVIPIEKCLEVNENYIVIPEIKKGANIRLKGEEIKKGEVLVKKGEEITPEIIALLSSQGIVNIKVFVKPKVAILSTGNELKEPFEEADADEIYNVNSYAIKSLLEKNNFKADIIGIVPDSLEETIQFIKSLKRYDVIITTGGISFGDADFIYEAFLRNGLSAFFRGIMVKPGRPTMVGIMENTLVFALPGNPLSSYLNAFALLIPTLRKLSGAGKYFYNYVYAKNKTEFKTNPKKDHTILGKFECGEWEVYKNYKYGSGMLTALSSSNSLVILGKREKVEKEILKVIPFNIGFCEKSDFFND